MVPDQSNKLRAFIRKIPLIGWLYRQISSAISAHRSLSWHHDERDPKDNNSTTPPSTEKIELHCVWAVEAFTPSRVNDLLLSIKKLGWHKQERFGRDQNLIEWIEQSRSHAFGGSWMNGGIIESPKNQARFLGESKKSVLPLGVDFARLSLHSITSSTTLVVIQFVLTDEYAHSLNEPFSHLYKTKIEYWPSWFNFRWIQYVDVERQKRKGIKKKLNSIHYSIYDWFTENLPGHFSANGDSLPTVDLITTSEFVPPKEDRDNHYSDLLFDYNYERWKCKDISDLEIRLPWSINSGNVAVLFGNYHKLTTDTEAYGGKNRAALTSKLHMAMDGTIGLWVMHNLLLNYEKKLLKIRDRVLHPITNLSRALKDLTHIRDQFISASTDIQSVSFDVASLTNNKGRYSHDCVDFSPPDFYKGKISDFLELLRNQDSLRSETLSKLEAQVNASINAGGNLTSAIANLYVQRSMKWLTLLIGVLTILLSLISIYQKDPTLRELSQKMDSLIELVKNSPLIKTK